MEMVLSPPPSNLAKKITPTGRGGGVPYPTCATPYLEIHDKDEADETPQKGEHL